MLNVYFKVVDTVTRPILNELREKRYRTVKYWFNVNDREQICYLRDTNYINHSNTDYNLTCYSWDIEQCGICLLYTSDAADEY